MNGVILIGLGQNLGYRRPGRGGDFLPCYGRGEKGGSQDPAVDRHGDVAAAFDELLCKPDLRPLGVKGPQEHDLLGHNVMTP